MVGFLARLARWCSVLVPQIQAADVPSQLPLVLGHVSSRCLKTRQLPLVEKVALSLALMGGIDHRLNSTRGAHAQ